MMKVLLVEDSRFTRGLLLRELSACHEVHEAKDGLEGLTLYDQVEPDIVLLDLQMPRMDGFQFIRSLHERGYEGPIVVCSANTQASVERRVYELGATLFVPKPQLLSKGRSLGILDEALERHVSKRTPVSGQSGRFPFAQAVDAAREVFRLLSGLDVEVLDPSNGPLGESYAGQSGLRVILALSGLIQGTSILQLAPPAHLLGTGALVKISNREDAEKINRVAREVTGTLAGRLSQLHGLKVSPELIGCTELTTGNEPPEPCGVVVAARLLFEGEERAARLTLTMHLPTIVELVAHLGMPN